MAYALGTDVSFYQDNNETPRKVDFVKMKSAGAAFVIIRAGQNSWVDPDFADYWRDAKAADVLRGSYWYYDSRYPPEKQADLLVNTLWNDLGELPIFIDIEESYGGSYDGATNWKKCVERVRARVPNKEIGIYTAYYYWKDNCPVSQYAYFGQFPLWVANYYVNAPTIPPGWNDCVFWQFSSVGDGLAFGAESLGIDLDYYHGSVEQLHARYGGIVSPPAGNVDTPFMGVTRVRGDGVQVLTIEPGSIERVEIV